MVLHPDNSHRLIEFERQELLAKVALQQDRDRALGRRGRTRAVPSLTTIARAPLALLTMTTRAVVRRAVRPTPTVHRSDPVGEGAMPQTGT